MATLKWSEKNVEVELVVVPHPKDGRVGIDVALMLILNKGPLSQYRAASYTTYKHPADTHDPQEGIKHALPQVLKALKLRKGARAKVWDKLRNEFPVGEFMKEYVNTYFGRVISL